jgi:hypothetical protein
MSGLYFLARTKWRIKLTPSVVPVYPARPRLPNVQTPGQKPPTLLFPGRDTATTQKLFVRLHLFCCELENAPSKYIDPQKQTLFQLCSMPDLKFRSWMRSCVCVMIRAPPSVWSAPGCRRRVSVPQSISLVHIELTGVVPLEIVRACG